MNYRTGVALLDESNPRFRDKVYQQIWEAALAVARNQQRAVSAHAEDIAMSVVEKFASRHMTAQVDNPSVWGAVHARYACTNFANRQLPRDRREAVDDEGFWDEHMDGNPSVYPYKAVAGADAIEFALACLSDRERELVHLVDAGYSHAEVAEKMGYAGARSVTTTLNRIRKKILDHVGGEDELQDLLNSSSDILVAQMAIEELQVEQSAPEPGPVEIRFADDQ
jgi:DNA-directed RNA polymerase specialized sigma24 family protein